ncbi:MAG: serine acetyltransferase [Bacteroidaceae bacterium]|nr:serine acetyltransferase [Bacteroidaceae bacterium]
MSSTLKTTIDSLSNLSLHPNLFRLHCPSVKLPSVAALKEIIQLLRSIIFPGYYGSFSLNEETIPYHIGTSLERLAQLLAEQIEAGLCFECAAPQGCESCQCLKRAKNLAEQVITKLPELRDLLATDVEAAYMGDPAAHSRAEVISCYPAIKALTCYRLAHELHRLGVPLIPRIITEMAHNETGIDIHPGAQIGPYFTIDHGTGVVIGATCIIGAHVKLYQGVTLGAKSFPLDEDGNPIKHIPRHPILEDGVIVYSNATILGRITIGKESVIGANVWITHDVEAGTKVLFDKK